MKKTTFVIGIGLALSSVVSIASTQKIDELFKESRYRKHIKTLASDEFGGRGPASPEEKLTVDYLIKNFKSYGMQPGNAKSFTQEVPLIASTLTNTPTIELKGKGSPLTLESETDFIVFSRRQQQTIKLETSDLVFVGYGINAPERNWNDYEGIDVKGKTVIILVNDPGYATQDPKIFNGNAMTYYGRWTYKYDEAARQGAAAALIVHDTKPAAYPWSTVVNSWTGKQFDIQRSNKGKDLSLVEGWLSLDATKKIFAKAGLDFEKQMATAKSTGFKAVPMNLNASTTLKMTHESVVTQNVIARLPGTKRPDEYFVFTAHWDHLGRQGDKIFNGALDNATGTAALLELASAFGKAKNNERSIIFLATTAEEQGLLGSQYYAEHPIYPLEKTVAGLNMDGMNIIGPTKDLIVLGYNFSELDHILSQVAKKQGRYLAPDPKPENGYYFRSDHFEFAKRGVPMWYLKFGHDHMKKGNKYGKAVVEEYLANHYHRSSDEYHEDWDLTGSMADLKLYYQAARQIIDSETWPNWNKGSEFKAIRDAQLKSIK